MRQYYVREVFPLIPGDGVETGSNISLGRKDKDAKWHRLEHNGVLFPPPYEPHCVRPLCDGVEVFLNAEAEEMATAFAQILLSENLGATTRYSQDPLFRTNMFEDWQLALGVDHPIQSLTSVDFSPIVELLEAKRLARLGLSKEEKKQIREMKKREKEERDEVYGYAIVDGNLQKIGGYVVEGPGWFRGRGRHQMSGRWKRRLWPKDVILNLSEGSLVPRFCAEQLCHLGDDRLCQWGGITHNPNGSYIARWRDPLTISQGRKREKFVFLDASSEIKSSGDREKFEMARKLGAKIKRIRKFVNGSLKSNNRREIQHALCIWMIDSLALRVGGEKDPELSSDTVGVCTLRVEHVSIHSSVNRDIREPESKNADYVMILDFLGKDSMRYERTVGIPLSVYNGLSRCMYVEHNDGTPPRTKDPSEQLFELVSTSSLNKLLKEYMPGLSAKVFRTYNASHLLQKELSTPSSSTAQSILSDIKKLGKRPSDAESIRTPPLEVSDPSQALKSKTQTSPLTVSEQRVLRQYYDFCHREVAVLCNHLRAVPKGFEQTVSRLADRLESQKVWLDMLKIELAEAKKGETLPRNERKNRKGEKAQKKARKAEVVEKAITKQKNVIATLERQIKFRFQSKEIALGTSTANYIDPRITVAWCKRTGVPVEKALPKRLQQRFAWALNTRSNFKW